MDGSGSDGTERRANTVPLEAVIIRYETRSDRCTVSPGDDQAARTAWLTADVDAFIDLDDMR